MKQEPHYLNTDLDLVAPVDLSPLGVALNALGLLTLHLGQNDDGKWCATFETEEVSRASGLPLGHRRSTKLEW